MSQTKSPDTALFSSPDTFLFALKGETAAFLPMNRDAYARSIFLDRRIAPVSPAMSQMPVADLLAATAEAPAGRVGWIFHVAHCGSTLLARALDHRVRDLVLREPMALRQLGIDTALMRGERPQGWHDTLRATVALLSRRYAPDAPVIVKANVPVNPIVPDLMALDPEAPAIFLYYPLAEYLMAVLRSPGHRQWVDGVTREIGPALEPWCGSLDGLDTFDRAAALWLAQTRIYADALARYPNARALDAEHLFDRPEAAVRASHAHFGIVLSDAELSAMLEGPLFGTYSKNPQVVFTNDVRRGRQDALRAVMQPRIDAASQWVKNRANDYPLPERLPKPLEGSERRPLL